MNPDFSNLPRFLPRVFLHLQRLGVPTQVYHNHKDGFTLRTEQESPMYLSIHYRPVNDLERGIIEVYVRDGIGKDDPRFPMLLSSEEELMNRLATFLPKAFGNAHPPNLKVSYEIEAISATEVAKLVKKRPTAEDDLQFLDMSYIDRLSTDQKVRTLASAYFWETHDDPHRMLLSMKRHDDKGLKYWYAFMVDGTTMCIYHEEHNQGYKLDTLAVPYEAVLEHMEGLLSDDANAKKVTHLQPVK